MELDPIAPIAEEVTSTSTSSTVTRGLHHSSHIQEKCGPVQNVIAYQRKMNKNIEILDLRIFLLKPPIFAYLPVYKDYNILGTESNDNIGPSNKSEDIKLVQFGR